MVENEVRNPEQDAQHTEKTVLNANEIMRKVGAFIDDLKKASPDLGGAPATFYVEGFTFSISKLSGEYTLTLNLKLKLKANPQNAGQCVVLQ